jgi:hypothetical protein
MNALVKLNDEVQSFKGEEITVIIYILYTEL